MILGIFEKSLINLKLFKSSVLISSHFSVNFNKRVRNSQKFDILQIFTLNLYLKSLLIFESILKKTYFFIFIHQVKYFFILVIFIELSPLQLQVESLLILYSENKICMEIISILYMNWNFDVTKFFSKNLFVQKF